MPGRTDAGWLRRLGVHFGLTWDFAIGTRLFNMGSLGTRRGVMAIATLAMVLTAITPAASFAATYNPITDMGSMYNTTTYTGARAWWNAGYTGAGVGVAIIDTGVSPVAGLDAPGKVVNGPDLSLESQNSDTRYLDTNGHGTFMAGLVAANSTDYKGMAPGARILSVKVGVADGGTDVSQVIAAINWVIQHRNDNGMNIRVMLLAYGTNANQDWKVDPLSYAAEQAYRAGITVVAAAGNPGYQEKISRSAGLSNPAYNPWLIAVGGSDPNGTANILDDSVGYYSATSGGGTATDPSFLAPGTSLQGLRVPNSYIDMNYPEGRIDSRYFRGSGTSEAAAIAAGAAALILQKYPNLTPDQVERFLSDTATKLPGLKAWEGGSGVITLSAALLSSPSTTFSQRYATGTGTGSLELARGTDHLTSNGVVLQGEIDIFGKTFDSTAMAALEAAGNSWSGGTWNGSIWAGNSWSGNSWSGNSWSGNSWSGNSWSGNSWSGNSWSGGSWN